MATKVLEAKAPSRDLMEYAAQCGVSFSFRQSERMVEAYIKGHMQFGDDEDSPQVLVLMGRHGIGKTSLLRQIGRRLKLAYKSFHAGAVDSQDNAGLPDKSGNFQRHLIPAHLDVFSEPKAETGFGLFVIEEFATNDNNEFQNQMRQLSEGRLGELEKHPKWVLAATTNPPTDAYSTVNMIDAALASRLVFINLEPLPEEVFGYMGSRPGFDRSFYQFLLMNPAYLSLFDPRSLFKLGGMLHRCAFNGLTNGSVAKLLQANSSMELATAFEEFKHRGNDPDLYPLTPEILFGEDADKKKEAYERIRRWTKNDSSDLIGATKMGVAGRLQNPETRGEFLDDAVRFALAIGEHGYADMAYDILYLFRENPELFERVGKQVKGTATGEKILELYAKTVGG